MVKATPMVQQYLSIKENHPNAILFFRMGDFYEMFFEDAKVASRILDIALTSRNKKDEEAIPMCGIPHHAAQAYIAPLIERGLRVAICEQVEDPAKAKGLVSSLTPRFWMPSQTIFLWPSISGRTDTAWPILTSQPGPSGSPSQGKSKRSWMSAAA